MPERQTLRRILWLVLLVSFAARSDVVVPAAEFWDYMGEFEDGDGETFDPLDLSDAEKVTQQQVSNAMKTAIETDESNSHNEAIQP